MKLELVLAGFALAVPVSALLAIGVLSLFHLHAPRPPHPMPPSPGPHSPGVVQRIVESLPWGHTIFNAPKQMRFGTATTIELLLSPEKSTEELQAELSGRYETEVNRARISNLMEAQLSGDGFGVKALCPEEQAVGSGQTTRWKWEVIPTKKGERTLHLTLSAIIDISGKDSKKWVARTLDRTIHVDITLGQRVSGFVTENWKWLWTTIPAVGLLIWRKFFPINRRVRRAGRRTRFRRRNDDDGE